MYLQFKLVTYIFIEDKNVFAKNFTDVIHKGSHVMFLEKLMTVQNNNL